MLESDRLVAERAEAGHAAVRIDMPLPLYYRPQANERPAWNHFAILSSTNSVVSFAPSPAPALTGTSVIGTVDSSAANARRSETWRKPNLSIIAVHVAGCRQLLRLKVGSKVRSQILFV